MTPLVDPATDTSVSMVAHIDSVDVWRGRLDLDQLELAALWKLLSADERRNAHKYGAEGLQRRFIARRGLLRRLLSCHLEVSPVAIQIDATKDGKPYVLGEPIEFSISHSFDCALFAFSWESRVGVDLERIREGFPTSELVSDHFTALESAALDQATASERRDLFFRLWTRKEACSKAVGTGLTTSLSRFQVIDPDGLYPLKVQDLELDGEHRAALCIAPR